MSDRLTFRADPLMVALIEEVMKTHVSNNLSDYIRGIIIRDYRLVFGELPPGTRIAIPAWVTAEETTARKILKNLESGPEGETDPFKDAQKRRPKMKSA